MRVFYRAYIKVGSGIQKSDLFFEDENKAFLTFFDMGLDFYFLDYEDCVSSPLDNKIMD